MGTSNKTVLIIIWAIIVIILLIYVKKRRQKFILEQRENTTDQCDETKEVVITGPVSLPLSSERLILPKVSCPNLHLTGDLSPYEAFGVSDNCESQDPWVYIHSGNFLARVNVETQAFVLIGNMGREMFDIAFADDGILYGQEAGSGHLYTIDTSTAATTLYTTAYSGFNSLCGGPNHTTYGVSGNNLYRVDLTALTSTILRTDIPFTLGDMVFNKGELWFTGGANRLYKIAGDPATGPFVDIGPVSSITYGLAIHNCQMWGFSAMTGFKLDQTNANFSDTFTFPNFGNGNYIQGAAKRDEALQATSYLVTIQSIACVPITISSEQDVTITFTDPNFTHQVVILAGGSFEIDENYNAINFVNAWLNN